MDHKTHGLLSGYYAAYFAVIGVWVPFWPIYLENQEYHADQIGLIIALGLGIKVLGPPVWGGLADRGPRHRVLIFTSWITLAAFLLYFFEGGFYWLLGVTALYSFFSAGPLGLVEATTLELVQAQKGDYGRIRVWGSVGFILLALLMGPLIEYGGLIWVLVMTALLLGSCAVLTLLLPKGDAHPRPQAAMGQLSGLFMKPGVSGYYLSVLLMQFSHGAYYGFYSIYLKQNGFDLAWIGMLWSLGVLSEVFLLSHSRWLLRRFGVGQLITFSLFLAAVRWIILGSTLWVPALLLAQTLHAFTFGSFHVASVQRAFDIAPRHLRATAQGWYSALSFGVGGALGLSLSGALYDRIGGASLYLVMAILAMIGVWVSMRSSDVLERQPPIKRSEL